MSGAEECIHLLDPATCTICNGRDRREKAAAMAERRVFPARFDGWCSFCQSAINVGDLISWAADEPVVHEECA